MSLQAYLRVEGEGRRWESSLFGYTFELHKRISEETGGASPYGFAVAIDRLYELPELDEERLLEEGIAEDEIFDVQKARLDRVGSFFDAGDALTAVRAAVAYLKGRPGEHPIDGRRKARAEDLVSDLEMLARALADAAAGGRRVRIEIG